MTNVCEMFCLILDERKRRAIDPTVLVLRKLHEFFDITMSAYAQVRPWPTSTLIKLVKLGDRIFKKLGLV